MSRSHSDCEPEKAKGQFNRTNVVILAGIASFTIIVVAGMWFFAGPGPIATVEPPVQLAPAVAGDSMADHHPQSSPEAAGPLNDLVGKPAPDFSLLDGAGRKYDKENLKGKNVVLFFNEGLMCYPACWNQIVELNKDPRLNTADTVALSVVVDSPNDWQQAVEKMPDLAEATVLFDVGTEVSQKMNMLTTPSSMHYGSLPGHSYLIFDKAGIVRFVLDDPTMSIQNSRLFGELQKLL
ncbi:MAG: redoxin domain-containing protein [Parcubacteria group bacterium]|nr:redoxin domain-containing protein [Parcubacteria group bacterium]